MRDENLAGHRVLEICCDSLESAVAAVEGGADRIELCVDLPEDGLTPQVSLLQGVKEIVGNTPVFVLVRCRAGGFVYSEEEVQVMCAGIAELAAAGADGIVAGALSDGGEVDRISTERFIESARGMPFTFHKAFDDTADLGRSMVALVAMGVDRVLTSGGARYAADALSSLERLAGLGGEQTGVLCGGGVRGGNLMELAGVPGLVEFHSAARASAGQPVDLREVRAMRAVLDSLSTHRHRRGRHGT